MLHSDLAAGTRSQRGQMIMTLFAFVLYALVVPYIALMLVVIAAAVRPPARPWSGATPPVSVIIPAHNEEERLEGALATLAEQRYPGALEFVVVDDRSTDGTQRIIRRFRERDPRFKLVVVEEPSRRLAPKVNAVNLGIQAASGEIIMTSDADCLFPPDWVAETVSHFADDVAMVTGLVETTRKGEGSPLLHRFETVDLLSLMLTKRALLARGWQFASSANNQAYRRSAFDAIGGFGASGRAPSGDEDLLAQRMARLQDGRIVFAEGAGTRVLSRPMPTLGALLNQRRRWVSRYRHVLHYQPHFLAGIVTLGLQSVLLSAAIVASVAVSQLAVYVLPLWAGKLAVEAWGMRIATKQLDREDLWGWPVAAWAVLHPFFIASVVLWSLFQSGEWHAGAQGYRRRLVRRRLRQWRRLIPGV